MRTTLTIDDDVAFGLERMKKREPKKPFKVLVNEALRRGLQEPNSPAQKPFVVKSRPLGLRKDINWNKVEDALDLIEGVNRR